jgi:hypothetical protein
LENIIAALEARLPGGIDSARVEELYGTCLAEELKATDPNYVLTEGILAPTAFDKRKLEAHREEISAMLAWLPSEFHLEGGGGWSFLNACDDRQGRQWTGLHRTMDMLFQLGMGLELCHYMMPRRMWSSFPGGMPYVQIMLPEQL